MIVDLTRLAIVDTADADRRLEDPDLPEWITDAGIEDLDLARLECQRMIRAARQVQGWVERRMVADIQQHGNVRLGDVGFRVGPQKKMRVVDPVGLVKWLHSVGGERAVCDAIRIDGSNVRATALKGIASELAIDPRVVFDSFTHTEWGDPKLVTVPVSQAHWVKVLNPGERRTT